MENHPIDSVQALPQLIKLPEELPTELWIEVIEDMEPRDVLSLSAVYRSLRSTLNQRDIWISVLRSLCRREGLFQPSYSFGTMDLEALQRAALGPYRWERMIEKHHANDTEDSPNLNELEPILTTEASPCDPRITGTTLLRLVPGGRFLLTAGNGLLKLWDIGPVGTLHHVGASLISEHPLEAGPQTNDDLVPCIVDEKTLRVAVATDEVWVVIRIFEISPTQHDAAFSLLASIRIANRPSFCRLWLHPRQLYLHTLDAGILWDFMLGQYTLVPYGSRRGVLCSGFTGAFVALFHPKSISLWSVPFKEEYLHPVPPGPIIISEGGQGFEPPAPDLAVELSLSAPGDDLSSPYLFPSVNPDPCSLTFTCRFRPARNLYSHRRLIVKQDLADRHRMEAIVEILDHFILPPGYRLFLPWKAIDITSQQSCSCALGMVPLASGRRACLRTVPTNACGTLSEGHVNSIEGGDVLTVGHTTATMTVVGASGLTLCSASGRAASSRRRDADEYYDLYFHDYLTWGSVPT